jgi:hypothetical protein
MKWPLDHPHLFSLLEAGQDLNERQSAELLDYLESHPDLARDYDEFVGDLQQLDSGSVDLDVSASEWATSFAKIQGATLQSKLSPAAQVTKSGAGPTAGGPSALSPEGMAGSGSAGLLISFLVTISLIFLCMQMTPDSLGPPVPSRAGTNGKTSVPGKKNTIVNPNVDLESDEPDVIIEDLEVSDDYSPRVTLADEDGDITIIWIDQVEESH